MSADAKILRIAAKQHDLVTLSQATSAGITERQIRYRVQQGSLVAVHRTVFRTAGSEPTLKKAALAGCLAAGDGAFASHGTGLTLWGLGGPDGDSVHVTVPSSRRPRLEGVIVHRSDTTGASQRVHLDRVPVSSLSRTLVDVASMPPNDLERLVDAALRTGHLSPDVLLKRASDAVFDNRPGIAVLREMAKDRVEGGVPESALESDTEALLKRCGLPAPIRQHKVIVAGRRVRFDLAYPDERIGIELDGRSPHWGRDRWQSDHRRDIATELGGWRVLRFTWWDVNHDPLFVVVSVAQLLGIHPIRWSKPCR